ncbi:outer membrane beta-barrel protein [Rasiella sp. SM2506]|uniref:outer membrane beta-barrel protein n=1 Tax=Rasiella sp. SM2506 TaxID=3423914 RepID=UPI003D7BE300
MKFQKLLLTLTLFTTFITYSQHQKGSWTASAAISPYPIEVNGENDFGVLGIGSLEFFVSEKVSFSGSFFTSNNDLFKNDSGLKLRSYGFIPGVQYYFLNNEKFAIYGQAGYGFGFKSDERTNLDNEALRIYNLGAGAHYQLSEKWFVSLLLPYFNAKDITFNQDEASGVAVFLGAGIKL